jgi:hypothetical protein
MSFLMLVYTLPKNGLTILGGSFKLGLELQGLPGVSNLIIYLKCNKRSMYDNGKPVLTHL